MTSVLKILRTGVACGHRGCLQHVTHPCEGCGRINGRVLTKKQRVAYLQKMVDRWDDGSAPVIPIKAITTAITILSQEAVIRLDSGSLVDLDRYARIKRCVGELEDFVEAVEVT
jgi:hypothetical protein